MQNSEQDTLALFLVSEQNMFHPNQFLKKFKFALENNLDYSLGFNTFSISLLDKKIYVSGYYYGGEEVFEFSEFEIRLLDFYQKYPYEFSEDENENIIIIADLKEQIDQLILEIKTSLGEENFTVDYFNFITNHTFRIYKNFKTKSDFQILAVLTPKANDFTEITLHDLTPEQQNEPNIITLPYMQGILKIKN